MELGDDIWEVQSLGAYTYLYIRLTKLSDWTVWMHIDIET
jgi:hypothetical protein